VLKSLADHLSVILTNNAETIIIIAELAEREGYDLLALA